MARLLSPAVIGGGLLLGSPALHAALVAGTMPVDTAALRLVAAVLFVWVGVTLIATLVEGTSAPVEAPSAPAAEGVVPGAVLDQEHPVS